MAKKTTDIGYLIRTGATVLAYWGAMAYFFHECAVLVNNFHLLVAPSVQTTVPWLIHLAVSSLILIMMAGVAAALVRPLWLGLLATLLGVCLFPLIVGSGLGTWISAGVALFFLISNQAFVNSQMKNQIQFSSHPAGEKKIIVATLLAVMISVSLGLGYLRDAAKNNTVFPPFLTNSYIKMTMNLAKSQIDAQAKAGGAAVTEEMKQKALSEAETKLKQTVADWDTKAKPQLTYIGVGLGVFAFFMIQMVYILLALLTIPLIPLMFLLLKLTHFTQIESEKVVVSRITLKTVD
jgi:hypothetical protein